MEKIIIVNLNDIEYRKVQNIAGRMKLTTDRINCTAKEDFDFVLEDLYRGKYKKYKNQVNEDGSAENIENTESIESNESALRNKSLILICGLSEKRLDKVLFELRRAEVSTDFKAILTQTNKNWTLSRLFSELSRERAAMESR